MNKPWYKQFWPWFIFSIPAFSVFYSLLAVYIFSQHQVDLVAEDYYKKGKTINVDLSRIRIANALNISAQLKPKDNNNIGIILNKGELRLYPNLRVTFSHRTLPNKDFSIMLSADLNGHYKLSSLSTLSGPWFVKLEPFNNEWVLQGKVNMPILSPVLFGKDNTA